MTARKTLATETNRTLRRALTLGIVDDNLHAGLIHALRMLAKRIDAADPDKVDSASMPTYLRYCERMGLVPNPEKPAVPASSGTPKRRSDDKDGEGGDGSKSSGDELAAARAAARSRRGA